MKIFNFAKKQTDRKKDYYRSSWKSLLRYAVESLFLCAAINYLFYKNSAAFFFLWPIGLWYVRQRLIQEKKHRRSRIWIQFRDALSGLQVSISAGYSIENAIVETRKDLEKLYGKKGELALEFSHMERQLSHGTSAEKLLSALGRYSGIEDIQNFSQILIQSKKMGGNMKNILHECISSIEEQMDVKKEIHTMLASRRLEQKIMSLIPLGIILYMQISTPDFLSVLYGNFPGICIMTFCLFLYLFAYHWGERLVDIEV